MRATRIFLALATVLISGTAYADMVTRTYVFTGADLLNNVFVSGADGSTPVNNDLYDGARLLRVGTDGAASDAGRTYVASQQDKFTTRWSQYAADGYVFDSFNLWGLDGRGANWGEDYKPYEFVAMTAPAGWSTGLYTWPSSWGASPAGAITTDFPWWQADVAGEGLSMTATPAELAGQEFSVTIKFDTDNMWWEQDVGKAPNTLNELTMWFGGYLEDYSGGSSLLDYHLYEGNMSVVAVPLPGAVLLGMLGLAYAGRRLRKMA
jgi:hypothetical protein